MLFTYIFLFIHAFCFHLTLFLCHFIPSCNVSKCIVCLCSSVNTFVHLSASFLVWLLTFTDKSDCEILFTSMINLVLSVTNIIPMLVKLFQMIWGYVTSFLVSISLSVCIFGVWKICISHPTGSMLPMPILVGSEVLVVKKN